MSNTFNQLSPNVDFPALDHKVMKFWDEINILKASESINANKNFYVFYDGPPGTNGRPHIGHIMQSALKDVWPRYKTMRGYTVLRKGGWDTHGLPVELTSEKELGLSGKVDIEKYGIKNFIDYCRITVLRYRGDWVQAIKRVGRLLDLEDDYLTMSNDFIQSDWWGLKVAFDKGLLYKDYKIVPYCCRCGTGLSNHEVAQGYADITDLTITAKFALKDSPNTYMLAWTTTPWTLLGNVALAVNEKIEYSRVKVTNSKTNKDEILILATETIEKNKEPLGKYEVLGTVSGASLVGKRYAPLWDFSETKDPGDAHLVVADDYVTTDDGTGVVHLALYGDDDFRLIKKFSLKQNQHVGPDGKFNPHCAQYTGRFFREDGLDVDIVKDLAARELLFHKYRYSHSYPHCWRCSTPLMYFAKSSWFIKTTAFKDIMLSENQRINWYPNHIKNGRFGNWLENNVDWAVSRERYWGSPVNIWTNTTNPTKMICVESISALQKLGAYFESSGKPIPSDMDLHIPIIDDVVFKDSNGDLYRREIGVLDCWYNAGIMPWGQFGYPAKEGSKDIFAHQFPADFICEAIDQTRGWFYTLLAVSCLITEKSSFKNVICTELILDASGKKMSKSLGNVIDPVPLIEKFGADAVRWTFYQSDPWQVKRYSEDLPKEALRAVFIPIWNCLSFFTTYAALDKWTPQQVKQSSYELDRWILSSLRTAVIGVTDALDNYDISVAAKSISDFVESLTNWYIRRSRKRFWKSENDEDKIYAYSTLYTVLVDLSQLIAPMAPFIAETIYKELVVPFEHNAPRSVHLTKWLSSQKYTHEPLLEEEIAVVQEAASLARSLRTDHDLRIRQPLKQLIIVPSNKNLSSRLSNYLESLEEEINIKEIQIVESSSKLVEYTVKPNWRALGPRFGKHMKEAGEVIKGLSGDKLSALLRAEPISLVVGGESFELTAEELVVEQRAKEGMVAKSGRSCTVVMNIELTPELIIEGTARDLLSAIQKERKNQNYRVDALIGVKISGGSEVEKAVEAHKDFIAKECLAREFSFSRDMNPSRDSIVISGVSCQIETRLVDGK